MCQKWAERSGQNNRKVKNVLEVPKRHQDKSQGKLRAENEIYELFLSARKLIWQKLQICSWVFWSILNLDHMFDVEAALIFVVPEKASEID